MTTIIKTAFISPISIADGGTGASSAAAARAALGITIGARVITGTDNQILVEDGDGSIGNPVVSISPNAILPGNSAVTVPIGTAAQRPGSPTLGMIRGNSDSGFVEVYSGGNWVPLPLISAGAPLGSVSATVTHTNLATGGVKIIIPSEGGSATYRLANIMLNGFGTNYSGGGGDRNISITDGTSVYTVIPAATIQALVNNQWGTTAVPFPASVPLNQASAAGANIYAIYSGGTTDYSAGSLAITLVYERLT